MMFGKIYPFLGDIREELGDQEFFRDIEQVVTNTKWGRDRLKFLLQRLESWRGKMQKKADESAHT